ncbi:MAG: SLAC1 anion channel family protein [Halopseudomonas yangmingensis]|uniref:Tellurite resistance protein n=1 Tax=Halopseudomonas yangmingensis TaxID=1720063 RepID=A0A1I4R7N7_9GAMM|nr:SLAC1 anion channel family protein [Halopseudomonas yangmingensis]SFM48006.1 tellurite resistance protein [Halopseudomonas yangmingensis]
MQNTGIRQALPLPLLASVMGIAGLGMVWRQLELLLQWPALVSQLLSWLGLLVLAAFLVGYVAKYRRSPQAVRGELGHPLRINFLPALSIGLVLLGALLQTGWPGFGALLWQSGALLQVFFSVVIINRWFGGEQPAVAINPAWFIPPVGLIVVPLAAVPAGWIETAWLFFAAGLVFWLILSAIVFQRLITGPALEPPLMPTLAILLAPPAVGSVSALLLAGEVAVLVRLLYGCSVLVALLLLARLPAFARLPFYPSWWAWSFPSAAFVAASLQYANAIGVTWLWPQLLLVAAVTLLIVLIFLRTLLALLRNESVH